eukprot:3622974-Pleurochrysis_carterae.AAC.1
MAGSQRLMPVTSQANYHVPDFFARKSRRRKDGRNILRTCMRNSKHKLQAQRMSLADSLL